VEQNDSTRFNNVKPSWIAVMVAMTTRTVKDVQSSGQITIPTLGLLTARIIIIIITIIKSIYIAQKSLESCKCAYEQLHVEQKCLQFVPERCQCNVWCSQCSRKTVPYTRSLDGETAVGYALSVTQPTVSKALKS